MTTSSEFQELNPLSCKQKRFSTELAYNAQGFPSRWHETPPDIVVLAHSATLRDHFPKLTRYLSKTLAACLYRFDPLAQRLSPINGVTHAQKRAL